MATDIIFLIGDRNIKYKGEYLEKEEVRQKSKALLERYQKERANITIQIIENIFEKYGAEKFSSIYLIVTNQSDIKYSKQDTIYVGYIIQKKLEEKYSISPQIKEYEWNPTDFSDSFKFFRRFVQDLNPKNTNVICISGGTPQMKQALTLIATNYLDDVQLVQVDEKLGEVKDVAIDKIKLESAKRMLLNLISNYDYPAALRLIENYDFSRKVKLLLEYAKYRLFFDFEKAQLKFEELYKNSTLSEREKLSNISLENMDRNRMFQELFWNMKIKLEREEYADFASRLYRFSEAAWQLLFDKTYNTNIDWISEEERNKQFVLFLNEHPRIRKRIKAAEKREEPTRNVLSMIIFNDEEKQTKSILGKIGKVVDEFRHGGFVAHGFGSISDEAIQTYPGDLIKDAEFIVNRLTDSYPTNPFHIINNLLSKYITNEI